MKTSTSMQFAMTATASDGVQDPWCTKKLRTAIPATAASGVVSSRNHLFDTVEGIDPVPAAGSVPPGINPPDPMDFPLAAPDSIGDVGASGSLHADAIANAPSIAPAGSFITPRTPLHNTVKFSPPKADQLLSGPLPSEPSGSLPSQLAGPVPRRSNWFPQPVPSSNELPGNIPAYGSSKRAHDLPPHPEDVPHHPFRSQRSLPPIELPESARRNPERFYKEPVETVNPRLLNPPEWIDRQLEMANIYGSWLHPPRVIRMLPPSDREDRRRLVNIPQTYPPPFVPVATQSKRMRGQPMQGSQVSKRSQNRQRGIYQARKRAQLPSKKVSGHQIDQALEAMKKAHNQRQPIQQDQVQPARELQTEQWQIQDEKIQWQHTQQERLYRKQLQPEQRQMQGQLPPSQFNRLPGPSHLSVSHSPQYRGQDQRRPSEPSFSPQEPHKPPSLGQPDYGSHQRVYDPEWQEHQRPARVPEYETTAKGFPSPLVM